MTGLIAYKGSYAQCHGSEGQKYLITTADGKSLKVRIKDFFFIHPEFIAPAPEHASTPELSNLEAFSDECLSIAEFTELLYDYYTPHTAWTAYVLIQDGAYAYHSSEGIVIRPSEHRDKIVAKRQADEHERMRMEQFAHDIREHNFDMLDTELVRSINQVAHGQLKTHKIFKFLDINPTPQAAFALLVRTHQLSLLHNPYPRRLGIRSDESEHLIHDAFVEYDSVDMTHLRAYAIDNTYSNDADDAISIDGDRVWVHIADVAPLMTQELIEYALKRVSNLYLPDAVHHMLPLSITQTRSLAGEATALSIGFCLVKNEEGTLILDDISIQRSKVAITTLSYDQAEHMLDGELELLGSIALQHAQKRTLSGAFTIDIPKVDVRVHGAYEATTPAQAISLEPQQRTSARMMVAEYMIMAGTAIAQYASQHDIAMPYASQEAKELQHPPNEEMSELMLGLTLGEKFAYIKTLPRSKTTTKPLPHAAMGLESYVRITSPLRRVLDLIAHIQLHKHLLGEETHSNHEMQEYITKAGQLSATLNACTRQSEQYYKLHHIQMRGKSAQHHGTVITQLKKKSLVFLTEYALIVEVSVSLAKDTQVMLTADIIDVFTLTSEWNVIAQ